MPNLLERLVHILRVINFGPNLAELISHNLVQQMPITSDVLTFSNSARGITDWDHFAHLESVVQNRTLAATVTVDAAASTASTPSRGASTNRRTSGTTGVPSIGNRSSGGAIADEEDITESLLNSFSPMNPVRGGGGGSGGRGGEAGTNGSNETDADGPNTALDLSNIVNVIQMARGLGIAEMTPLGEALLATQPPYTAGSGLTGPAATGGGGGGPFGDLAGIDGGYIDGADADGANDGARSDAERLLGTLSSFLRMRSARGTPGSSETAAQRQQRLREESADPRRAKRELQFHAMLLSPHQIELLFVLCTLLSGRRKIYIQQRFAAAGLGSVLSRMFDRMSWDAAPSRNNGSVEHIHGPDCECDPESALRVQFLRLVHNFYDRDFLGNGNKIVMLSSAEIERCIVDCPPGGIIGSTPTSSSSNSSSTIVSMAPTASLLNINEGESRPPRSPNNLQLQEQQQHSRLNRASGVSSPTAAAVSPSSSSTTPPPPAAVASAPFVAEQVGLLQRVITTLRSQKRESVYRFWLSACVENFLRGSGRAGQQLVADSGLLEYTVSYILQRETEEPSKNQNLQTSFDLLGEMVKCNRGVLQQLEGTLSNEDFPRFISVIMNNLVDSNVFLRSLYVSVEMLSYNAYLAGANPALFAIDPDYALTRQGFLPNAIAQSDSIFEATLADGSTMTYLTDTWVQFDPAPVSNRAIDIHARSSSSNSSIGSKASSPRAGLRGAAGRAGSAGQRGLRKNGTTSSTGQNYRPAAMDRVDNRLPLAANSTVSTASTALNSDRDHDSNASSSPRAVPPVRYTSNTAATSEGATTASGGGSGGGSGMSLGAGFVVGAYNATRHFLKFGGQCQG